MIQRSRECSPPPTSKYLMCSDSVWTRARCAGRSHVRANAVVKQRAAEASRENPNVTDVVKFDINCHLGFLTVG